MNTATQLPELFDVAGAGRAAGRVRDDRLADDYMNELQPLVRRELVLPIEQPKRAFTVIDGGRLR